MTIWRMTANSVHAAWQSGVKRFLFLGSTCIYPRMASADLGDSLRPHRHWNPQTKRTRNRQDRWPEAMPVLSTAVWRDVSLRNADEPLRPRRQLSS